MEYQETQWNLTPFHKCEFCTEEYRVKDSRKSGRLCPECYEHKADIDLVRRNVSYAQMSPEMKELVFKRVERNRTVRHGGNQPFNIKDPDGKLGIANEYANRFRKGQSE